MKLRYYAITSLVFLSSFANAVFADERVEIKTGDVKLEVGESVQMQAVYIDSLDNESQQNFQWTVEPDSLGTFNESGLFTAATEGMGHIKVTYEGLEDEVEIEVENPEDDDNPGGGKKDKSRIEIENKNIRLAPGETEQLSVVYIDDHNTKIDTTCSWAVNPDSLGTIDENYIFTAASEGQGWIIAELGDMSDSVKVTIKSDNGNGGGNNVDDESGYYLEILDEDIVIALGDSVQLTAALYDSLGNPIDTTITWSVTPPSLGEFDSDTTGLFISLKGGKGTITATVGDLFDEIKVEIQDSTKNDNDKHLPRIEILNEDVKLNIGENVQMLARYLDETGEEVEAEFTWSVSPVFLGSFDATVSGLFTADHAGKGHIFAVSGDLQAKVEIEVEGEDEDDDAPSKLPGVKILVKKVEIALGDSVQLAAAYYDSTGNEIDTTIVWSVDPTTLGVFDLVTPGLFFGLEEGKGWITAAVGDLSDKVKVDVEAIDDDENGEGGDNVGKRLRINQDDVMLQIGETIQFTAQYRIHGNTLVDTTAHWTIHGDSVGVLSEGGFFQAQVAGVAVVKAKLENNEATCTVTVIDPNAQDGIINTVTISRVLPNGHVLHPVVVEEGGVYKIGGLPYPLNLLNGGRIFFPDGSLNEDIEIFMMLPSKFDSTEQIINGVKFLVTVNGEPVEPYYFQIPLNLSIPFKEDLLDSLGIDASELGLFFMEGDGSFTTTGITNVLVDTVANRIYANIEHFSTLVIKKIDKTTDISEQTVAVYPENFGLMQNFPNPFNPETTIQFTLPKETHVTLAVYNLIGQKIVTLVDEVSKTGVNTVKWNGCDLSNNKVSSGLYFYTLRAGDDVLLTRKMVMMK